MSIPLSIRINRLTELPKSGVEAKALKVVAYFTGNPCKHGHLASRYASNGRCSRCTLETGYKCRAKKEGNTASAANRKRIRDIKDTGEYKEVWED